jgi:hypothetical protein
LADGLAVGALLQFSWACPLGAGLALAEWPPAADGAGVLGAAGVPTWDGAALPQPATSAATARAASGLIRMPCRPYRRRSGCD